MRTFHPLLIASMTLALPAFPQALTEHAAAAAGATIGTTAGKSLSNSMDRIFGNLEENTVHAAGVTKEEKKRREQALEPQAVPAQTADAGDSTNSDTDGKPGARKRQGKGAAKAVARTQAAATPLLAIPAPEPPAKEPVLEDFLSVKAGTKEEALRASLGEPTSRITIPDDGHLIEVLRYTAGGELLGVIRVDNGEVVSIQPAGQAR